MRKSLALLVALTIVAAACTGSDDTGPEEGSATTAAPIENPDSDTDGDGLTDAREVELGTSVELADTDGDGYSDFTEVVDLSFDAQSNPYRFNPVVADIPEIDIELVSAPTITIICTAGTGNTTQFTTSRSSTESSTVSTTSSGSESQALAFGVTVGSEVEAGTSGVKAKVNYSVSASETNTTTIGWSSTQSSTNARTLQESESYAQTNNETCTGGVVSISVSVENRGHIAFTLKDLVLSAFLTRTSDPSTLEPVGNLIFDTADQIKEFPDTTLGPGERISQLTFKNDSLDLASVRNLLADSRNLTIDVATAEVADSSGAAFAHSATTILANTATVLIDYGNDREEERYQVGTNQVMGTRGISLAGALREDLLLGDEIDVGTVPWDFDGDGSAEGETAPAITRIRTVATDSVRNGYWVLAVTADRGAGEETTVFSPLDDGYDPDSIELRAGDVAHLAYISDVDRDGVDGRVEFIHGTDPDNPDTDGDGLTDGEELRGWSIDVAGSPVVVHSDPTLPDTDRDGQDDAAERAAGSHPGLRAQPIISSVVFDGTGRTVTIDAFAEDLDGTVTSIEIDWGDGTSPFVESGTAVTAITGATHTYETDGQYTIVITPTDDSGFAAVSPPHLEILIPLGLFAHWPLDGSTADAATGNYDGTFYLDSGYGADRKGRQGMALNLVGDSQLQTVDFDRRFRTYPLVTIPHLPVSGELTMSAWVQHFNPRGNPSRIIGQGNWLNLFIDEGRVRFGILDERIPDANVIVSDPQPYGGTWTHFAGVVERDESGSTLVLYRDGEEVARRSLAGVFLDNPGECLFYIGTGLADVRVEAVATSADQQQLFPLTSLSECNTPWAGQLYPGSIDDVRVYEIALDAEGVRALFEAGP